MYRAYIFDEPLYIKGENRYGFIIGGRDEERITKEAASQFITLVIEDIKGTDQCLPEDVDSYDWNTHHHRFGLVTDRVLYLSDFEDEFYTNEDQYEDIKKAGKVEWYEIDPSDKDTLFRAKSKIIRKNMVRASGWSADYEPPILQKFVDYNKI